MLNKRLVAVVLFDSRIGYPVEFHLPILLNAKPLYCQTSTGRTSVFGLPHLSFLSFRFLSPTGAPRLKGLSPHISRSQRDSIFPEAKTIVLTFLFSSGIMTIPLINNRLSNSRTFHLDF